MPATHRRILLAAAATGVLLVASACGSNGESAAGDKAALIGQVMEDYFAGDEVNNDCVRDALSELSDADLRTLGGPLADAEAFEDQDQGPPQIAAITDQCIGTPTPEDMVPVNE